MAKIRLLQASLLLALAFIASSQSFAQENNVILAQTRDPQTGILYEHQMQKTPWEQLEKYRPSDLEKTSFMKRLRAAPATGVKGVGHILQHFPAEYALFTAGLGLVAARQMLFLADSNPAAVGNFWAHNIKDPTAYISFMGFMAGNNASQPVFQALMTRMGFMRDEKKFKDFIAHIAKMEGAGASMMQIGVYANAAYPVPKMDGPMRFLKGQVGMAVGLAVSGIGTEFFSDADVKECVSSWFLDEKQMLEKMVKERKAAFMACDQAFDRWMSTGKLYDLAPSIASLALTAVVNTFAVRPGQQFASAIVTRGAEKVMPLIFRGFTFGSMATKVVPQLRIMSLVLNTYIFLDLNNLLLAPIEDGFQKFRKAPQIAQSRKDILNVVLRPELPQACQQAVVEKFGLDGFQKSSSRMIHLWILQNAPDCGSLPLIFPDQLKEHHRLMSDWRGHWMRHAKTSAQSWQTYVQDFQVQYDDAFSFYKKLIQEINDPQSQLNRPEPFNGLGDKANPAAVSGKIAEAILFARKKIQELETSEGFGQKQALYYMKLIENQLSALDASRENWKSLGANQTAREEQFAKGVDLLNQTLRQHPYFRFASLENDPYGILTLSHHLKGADPTGAGWSYLASWATDEQIFLNPSPNFQKAIASVFFSNRAESLLGSFICGPTWESHQFVTEVYGSSISFSPPQMLTEDGRKFCTNPPRALKALSTSAPMPVSIRDAEYEIRGQRVKGFLKIAQQLLKPEFRGSEGLKNFVAEWNRVVQTKVLSKAMKLSAKFTSMLSKDFLPALQNQESYHYSTPANRMRKATELELKYGAVPSILEESFIYIELLKKILKSPALDRLQIDLAQINEAVAEGPSGNFTKVLTDEEQKLLKELSETIQQSENTLSRFGLAQELLLNRFKNDLGKIIQSTDLKSLSANESEAVLALSENLLQLASEAKDLGKIYEIMRVNGINLN